MVGRDVDASERPRARRRRLVLAVDDLRTRKLPGISFELRRGEVLGVAGLVGSGRSALGAALFGLDPILGGSGPRRTASACCRRIAARRG